MFDATPLLSLYAARRKHVLNSATAVAAQEHQLRTLLKIASGTLFGKQHGFSSVKTVEQYQAAVPLRTYESFWSEFWKEKFPLLDDCTWPGRIPYFAVSSGTSSGRTKYIPLSRQILRSNNKAGLDLLSYHLWNHPHSKLLGGKSFMLGGTTELVEQAPGIFSGDLSGIAAKTMPWWAARRYFPPKELALLSNWEEKIDRLAVESLKEDIRMVSGVPSWMLIFLKKLWELRPETTGTFNAYPNFELIVHGGVQFAPYLKQFSQLAAASGASLREVYPASEGFIAIADRSSGEGLRLNLDHGIFYEFIPVDELAKEHPTRHWIKNVENGVNYAIVLTTCAGLWSYVLGDTIKFVDVKTPRVTVTGRTSYFLSAFGEHLTGEEVERSVADAADAIGREVVDYSTGALYPENPGELGGHLIVIEFSGGVPDASQLDEFAAAMDRRLSALNEDFEAHRASGFGLNPPKVHAVPGGTFASWMKSRGKLGGQHKVPRVITDVELFAHLRAFLPK